MTMVVAVMWLTAAACAHGQTDGLLHVQGKTLFPLGFYELPKADAGLERLAEAGVNIVRCDNRAELDRAAAAGLFGWMPLNLAEGATDAFRAQVAAVADHPALAVWEGPDEVIWNFTGASRLHRVLGVHKNAGAWKRRDPDAVAYAEEQAKRIIPNMRAAAAVIRQADAQHRPLWINEARDSDRDCVRQYFDFVDITGCDQYPVNENTRNVAAIGEAVRDWREIGAGKPVWMVLQAFSWNELGDYYGAKAVAYPSFAESRFMAYDAIANGAAGLLYWGSHYLKSDAFRQSLYALVSELNALQPFLTAPDADGVHAALKTGGTWSGSLKLKARVAAGQWMLLLINEDDRVSFDVVVEGLDASGTAQLHRLYEPDSVPVANGAAALHIGPRGLVVCATDRAFESPIKEGRDFTSARP